MSLYHVFMQLAGDIEWYFATILGYQINVTTHLQLTRRQEYADWNRKRKRARTSHQVSRSSCGLGEDKQTRHNNLVRSFTECRLAIMFYMCCDYVMPLYTICCYIIFVYLGHRTLARARLLRTMLDLLWLNSFMSLIICICLDMGLETLTWFSPGAARTLVG